MRGREIVKRRIKERRQRERERETERKEVLLSL